MIRPEEISARIGAGLRAARVRKGESLADAAGATRIPKRYLEALEEDRFGDFEALVYLRGFLQSYCEHLELSFEPLWVRLDGPPPPAAESRPAKKPAPAPAFPAAPERWGLAATAAALLAALVIARTERPPLLAKPEPALPAALRPVAKPAHPRVELRAAGDAWLRAELDGRTVFEGVLPRGAALKWTPARALLLKTADGGAFRLSVDGKPRDLEDFRASDGYRLDLP